MRSVRWPVVLFDLDGTLADTIPLILASHDVATKQVLGIEFSEEERLSWIGRTLWDIYEDVAPDRVDEIAQAYMDWNREHLHLIAHYPGVNDMMADLRALGVQMGVVTSKRRPAAKATLEAVGLGWVPVVAAAFETAEHKPSPLPLRHGLAMLHAETLAAAYVGDAVVDMQSAQAAGLSSVAVTWGAGNVEELTATRPDAVVDNAAELLAALLDS